MFPSPRLCTKISYMITNIKVVYSALVQVGAETHHSVIIWAVIVISGGRVLRIWFVMWGADNAKQGYEKNLQLLLDIALGSIVILMRETIVHPCLKTTLAPPQLWYHSSSVGIKLHWFILQYELSVILIRNYKYCRTGIYVYMYWEQIFVMRFLMVLSRRTCRRIGWWWWWWRRRCCGLIQINQFSCFLLIPLLVSMAITECLCMASIT